MKKYLLAIGLVLVLVLAAPVATRAEGLNVAELRAIIASLQAQLNFLIAKLQLQIQQQNQATSTPTSKPSITITSPNGGESWAKGSTHNITWSSTPGLNVVINLKEFGSSSCFNEITSSNVPCVYRLSNEETSSWAPWTISSGRISGGNADIHVGNYVVEICQQGVLSNCDSSDNYFTITSATPSLKATLNVTALNGAIQCIKAPCEFPLSGAQVTVYDANKALVGNQIVGSNGIATFSNLNLGTYTVYVSASGYTQTSGQTVGLVAGQSASVKIPVFLTR